MADKITTSNELKFEFAFADGDTRIYRLKNPLSGNLSTQIDAINTMILANNLIIGDKASGAFTGIYRVTRINKDVQTLDLG